MNCTPKVEHKTFGVLFYYYTAYWSKLDQCKKGSCQNDWDERRKRGCVATQSSMQSKRSLGEKIDRVMGYRRCRSIDATTTASPLRGSIGSLCRNPYAALSLAQGYSQKRTSGAYTIRSLTDNFFRSTSSPLSIPFFETVDVSSSGLITAMNVIGRRWSLPPPDGLQAHLPCQTLS